jgi:hypothetical protein
MFDHATVTLSLKDLDALRAHSGDHIASALAKCFCYEVKEKAEPQECKGCKSEVDCPDCEHYTPNQCEEKLTVDVEKLIWVAKEYALYGKGKESNLIDIDAIPVERIERKAERREATHRES